MKKIIFLFIVLSFVIAGCKALAEESLPNPGTLPDSNFYFLKSWKESIQTFFTFGAENKAKQFLHLADVRLAEYQKMIEQNKTDIALKTLAKYDKQLNQAMEKIKEAEEEKGALVELDTIMREKRLQQQEALEGISEKMPEAAKKTIIEERQKQWTTFLSGVKEKFPEEPPGPTEAENLPAQLLLNCPLPAVPSPEACEGKWLVSSVKDCPYFRCPGAGKAQEPPMRKPAMEPGQSVPMPSATETPLTKPSELPIQPPGSKVCIQVITSAISPENVCKEFPTPCDVPAGWSKIDKCPSVSAPSTPSVPSKPTISSEPIPTEIRYYTCPDGTKVESGKCYGKGETFTCSILSSPELKCSAPTPPVTKGEACPTIGETKYYQCPNNTQTAWCVCGPESGAVGAKNVWRCQYLPELACPKPIVAPPVAEETVCCIDGKCAYEAKEQCTSKSGKVVNSCAECITPAPAPVPPACTVRGIKDYRCPDGTSIKWQCSCGEDSWSCKTNPAIFCPGLRDTTSLIISDIWIRDMFWTEEPPVPNVTQGPGIFHVFWGTNKPTTSYMEYGLTTSYGSTTPSCCLDIKHTNNGQTELRGGTLYHSRIIATDTQGNTAASDDYTFLPAFGITTIPGTVQSFIRLLGPGISPTHWKIGETPSIVWEARGVNKVDIDLVMFDSSGNRLKTYSIAKGVSSSGTAGGSYIYTWKVPSNSEFFQAGYKFKVVISDPATFVFGTNDNDLFIEE